MSLELARSLTARREEAERQQAFALYELARHALFSEDLDEALQSIAMVVATTLDHEAAHVWLRSPDRLLRRHAAYPHLGTFIGRLVASAARRPSETSEDHTAPPTIDIDSEAQLAESQTAT